MPGVLTDIVHYSDGHGAVIQRYIDGHCYLAKQNALLAANYPFHATRTEFFIARMLTAGTYLRSISLQQLGTSGYDQTYFAFDFLKR